MLFSDKINSLINKFSNKPKTKEMDFSEPKSIKVSQCEIINGKAYRITPCGPKGAILERI